MRTSEAESATGVKIRRLVWRCPTLNMSQNINVVSIEIRFAAHMAARAFTDQPGTFKRGTSFARDLGLTLAASSFESDEDPP